MSREDRPLDIAKVRSFFPSLSSRTPRVFADNAAGAQCCQQVIDRTVEYLSASYVQSGSGYSISKITTDRINMGRETSRVLFNASRVDEIAVGSSTTIMLESLARAIEWGVAEGDEIVLMGEHDASVGPWRRLAERKGLRLRYWFPSPVPGSRNPYAVAYDVRTLLPLITRDTRLVAFFASSNVLGSAVDVKSVIRQARVKAAEKGAKKIEFYVDAVAYAPHRAIDVQDWDVDYAAISFYKVYGPHVSALYTRLSKIPSLKPPFAWLTVDMSSWKIVSGGPAFELIYATTGVLEYLLTLSPMPGPTSLTSLHGPGSIFSDPKTRNRLKATYAAMTKHEKILIKRFLGHLTSKRLVMRGVRVIGEETASELREPTISFVVVKGEIGDSISGKDIVKFFNAKGSMGIRYGHFYSVIMLETLSPKVDLNEGLVRISLVHYNTVEEVDRLLEVLDEALGLKKEARVLAQL